MNKQEIKEFILDFKKRRNIIDKKKQKSVTLRVKEWRQKYPEKKYAQRKVFIELRAGRLKKNPCVKCGCEMRVEAHHEDYFKPLDIVWLCKKHHVIADIERRKRLAI